MPRGAARGVDQGGEFAEERAFSLVALELSLAPERPHAPFQQDNGLVRGIALVAQKLPVYELGEIASEVAALAELRPQRIHQRLALRQVVIAGTDSGRLLHRGNAGGELDPLENLRRVAGTLDRVVAQHITTQSSSSEQPKASIPRASKVGFTRTRLGNGLVGILA